MKFKISPRIVFHFGENLIRNDSIALLELVKNSYDACALNCHVHFNFIQEKLDSIKITDDGCGMDMDTIKNIWFTIGTDNKSINTVSSCGRFPLGEKGIGRFGTHKLGNIIKMKTKTQNTIGVTVNIDWNLLQNVKAIDQFDVNVVEDANNSTVGTEILINDLKTTWDRRQLREVYRNLMSLNSPFKITKNNDFNVKLTSNSNIFDGLPNIDDIMSTGMYFGKCVAEGSEIVSFNYEFRPWKSLTKLKSTTKKTLKDLLAEERKLQFYPDNGKKKNSNNKEYIDLDKDNVGKLEFQVVIFETDMQILSLANTEKTTLRNYLRENGGIRVYRDNVRVYNYGERDDDWLGIDIKRVSRVGGNVSNNIIVGAVMLDRKTSSGLQEKTNREGFVENEAFNSLVEATNYILSLFVKYRNLDKHLLTTLYKKHKVVEPVLSDLESAIDVVKQMSEIKTSEKQANEALVFLYRVNDQYRNVRDVLLKSANAGLNLATIIHELDKLVSVLILASNKKEYDKIKTTSKLIEDILNGYSSLFRKTSIGDYNLASLVKNAIDMCHYRFIDHKIVLKTNYESVKLTAKLSESEAIGCIINLLDNAIYWLCYAKNPYKQISIYVTDRIKNYNSIIVCDNGPGFNIPESIAIEPFITGKPHNIGMGLGLHIVKETMFALGGELMFLEKNELELPKINNNDTVFIALCFKKK